MQQCYLSYDTHSYMHSHTHTHTFTFHSHFLEKECRSFATFNLLQFIHKTLRKGSWSELLLCALHYSALTTNNQLTNLVVADKSTVNSQTSYASLMHILLSLEHILGTYRIAKALKLDLSVMILIVLHGG